MKKFIILLATIIATCSYANAQYGIYGTSSKKSTTSSNSSSMFSTGSNPSSIHVNSYTRSNGTYVQGHNRSVQNSTNHDNYSTIGNTNPFTGTTGSRAADYSTRAYNYGSGQTIHTGSRGGQYYINSHGNKTYVPKRR